MRALTCAPLLLAVALSIGFASSLEGGQSVPGVPLLELFMIRQAQGDITLRFSYKRRDTSVVARGEGEQRELVIPVSHLHMVGSCHGRLVITPSTVQYVPDEGDHAMRADRGSFRFVVNHTYDPGPTVEMTPRGSGRMRFTVACTIRNTTDTSGRMHTCGNPQFAVVHLIDRAISDFDGLHTEVVEAARSSP
jgi:hypothetical protein